MKESPEQRAERLSLYEEYKLSGEGVTSFSRGRGIDYSKMRRIIQKSRKELGEEVFREIKVPTVLPPGAPSQEYRITLRNGRELSLPENFTGSKVRALMEILERC